MDSSAADETRPMLARSEARGEVRDRVGRYLVLQRLGRGGMGEVLLAFDPELDRKVAVKLLRPLKHNDPKRRQALQLRLIREAQALAKLQHPNVVAVHDVGTFEGKVFIAMEYIEGPTLSHWAAGERPWKEVVRVMLEAGRGLAAAHEVGLIHRDFKPGNVMLGLTRDERPRKVVVLDFGLATQVEEPTAATGPGSLTSVHDDTGEHSAENRSSGSKLTRTGARLGTPAYMAPEQHLGATVSHAADQFGFCVSLFEALYGMRPFAGDSDHVGQRITGGDRRDFPSDPAVPSAVRRVIERGLEADPRKRYPSMADLLLALERTIAPRSNRVAWTVASLGIVAFGGYALAASGGADEPVALCTDSPQRLHDIWGPSRRDVAAKAFANADPLLGESSAKRASALLDVYAQRWIAGHRDACEATHVRQEQSEEMLDLRMGCLEDRRRRLAALVGVFEHADRTVVRGSVEAVAALPSVQRCADRERLRGVIKPDATVDPERVERIEAAIADANARADAGLYEDAQAELERHLAEADAIGFRPLASRVRVALGRVLSRRGQFDQAAHLLEQAYFDARRDGDPQTVAEAGIMLAFVVGERQGQPESGLSWARHSSVELEQLEDRRLDLAAAVSQGGVLATAGELQDARHHLERAVELASRGDGSPIELAGPLTSLTSVALAQGKFDEAEQLGRRAVEIRREALGPDHPEVAKSLANLGNVFNRAGRLPEASEAYEEALQIQERVLGARHPDVASTLSNLGLATMLQRDFDAAARHQQRALDIRVAALGSEHPHVATSHASIGEIEVARGRFDEAIVHFERARDIWSAGLGPQHRSTALALHHLGATLHMAGRSGEAIEPLERSLVVRQQTDGDPGEVAESKFDLAQALWASQRDPQRAVELARQARDEFDPRVAAGYVDKIDTWLADK